MTARPARLTRVEWTASTSYEHPGFRTQKARNFAKPEHAARQVAIVAAWPLHCTLTGVWETACEWTEVDVRSLPLPPDEEEVNEDAE
jgi:hypothetical protein